MLYVAGLISVLLAWLLNNTGLTQDKLPRIILAGHDIGFYIVHLALFVVVWFVLWFMRETGFARRAWLDGIASRQGTSRFVDALLLLGSVVLGASAAGASTLSSYLQLTLLLCAVAAGASLATGRERRLAPPQMAPTVGDTIGDSTSLQSPQGDTP